MLSINKTLALTSLYAQLASAVEVEASKKKHVHGHHHSHHHEGGANLLNPFDLLNSLSIGSTRHVEVSDNYGD